MDLALHTIICNSFNTPELLLMSSLSFVIILEALEPRLWPRRPSKRGSPSSL